MSDRPLWFRQVTPEILTKIKKRRKAISRRPDFIDESDVLIKGLCGARLASVAQTLACIGSECNKCSYFTNPKMLQYFIEECKDYGIIL